MTAARRAAAPGWDRGRRTYRAGEAHRDDTRPTCEPVPLAVLLERLLLELVRRLPPATVRTLTEAMDREAAS